MRIPNPNWSKVPKYVQDTLRTTNADTARMELEKEDNSTEGLNTEKTINEIVQYGEAGYSSIVARGKKGEQLKVFDSRKKIPSRRLVITKGLDDDAKWNCIIDALGRFINERFK
jgi:hypothetical protein